MVSRQRGFEMSVGQSTLSADMNSTTVRLYIRVFIGLEA